MASQLDIAREALAQIGTRSKIASLTDGSAEAQYVNLLYAPLRDFLLREGDYDFSMVGAALVLADIDSPVSGAPPWGFAYEYPAGALRIRQVLPSDIIEFDPRPMEWSVASVAGQLHILTHRPANVAFYTAPVDEALWDAMFHQSFVRMLASALAFALENRIEASKQKMEEAMSFAGIANLRDS